MQQSEDAAASDVKFLSLGLWPTSAQLHIGAQGTWETQTIGISPQVSKGCFLCKQVVLAKQFPPTPHDKMMAHESTGSLPKTHPPFHRVAHASAQRSPARTGKVHPCCGKTEPRGSPTGSGRDTSPASRGQACPASIILNQDIPLSSAPQEHLLSTPNASASRVSVTFPLVPKGPGEDNLTGRNLLLPDRSVYSPPWALGAAACSAGVAGSQTDSTVRSHSSQSSRFLTPPSLPRRTQWDLRSTGSALRGAQWLMPSSNCQRSSPNSKPSFDKGFLGWQVQVRTPAHWCFSRQASRKLVQTTSAQQVAAGELKRETSPSASLISSSCSYLEGGEKDLQATGFLFCHAAPHSHSLFLAADTMQLESKAANLSCCCPCAV